MVQLPGRLDFVVSSRKLNLPQGGTLTAKGRLNRDARRTPIESDRRVRSDSKINTKQEPKNEKVQSTKVLAISLVSTFAS